MNKEYNKEQNEIFNCRPWTYGTNPGKKNRKITLYGSRESRSKDLLNTIITAGLAAAASILVFFLYCNKEPNYNQPYNPLNQNPSLENKINQPVKYPIFKNEK